MFWLRAASSRPGKRWRASFRNLPPACVRWRSTTLFFLSRLPHEEAGSFIAWAEGHLQEQPNDFRARFIPALRGLALIHGGGSLDNVTDIRRFLGWTQARHWLLGDEPLKSAR